MSEKKSTQDQSGPKAHDVPALLQFSGPSTRLEETIPDGLALIGFRSTDQNEVNISRLLSALTIPFYMRRDTGWGGSERQMFLVVPADRHREATEVLKAAAEEGSLDLAEGLEGLTSY